MVINRQNGGTFCRFVSICSSAQLLKNRCQKNQFKNLGGKTYDIRQVYNQSTRGCSAGS